MTEAITANGAPAPRPTPSAAAGTGVGAAAAAAPAPIPWLGVASVLVGLSISVFFGQFLNSGLPDLRGAQHLSVDQGAWMSAAFNAGQMFIGPMSVYLGGLLGTRRVLLVASVIVLFATALIPLVTSYAVILALLAITGLSAGCFYPLTLTFIMRGLPPRLLLFGVACYTIDAISSVHLSTSLQSWYMQHLSWQWLYWHFSILAPLMTLLVFFGMPRPAPKQTVEEKKTPPSWRGFLYASCGLTLIYLGLTQGERLNWLHSGVIVALFVSGGFLLLTSLVRHFVRPLPFIDWSVLQRRNIILLSFCLITMRYSLLSSATVVPSFLGNVQGYRPEQTAPVLAVVAIPMLIMGLLAALALRFIDPRLVLASGFALMAIACLWDHQLTSAWAAENFLHTELLLGIGLALTIIGLVGSILLAAVNGGALQTPVRALTVAAWFHSVRIMGGEIGVVALTRLLDVREKFHSNMLGQSVTLGNPLARQQLIGTVKGLTPQSALQGVAAGRAAMLVHARIAKQAYTLASTDSYVVFSMVLTFGLILVACIKKEPITFQQVLSPKKEGI